MVKEYSKYTKELGEEICRVMSCSVKPLKILCAENPHWPVRGTIWRWTLDDVEFRNLYDSAKRKQVEFYVEEILDIAYNSLEDVVVNELTGRKNLNSEYVARSKLKIDTIKWIACKIAPKMYGDKLQVEKIDLTQDADIIRAKEISDKIKRS